MCDIRFAQSVMESIDQLYEECSNIKCREEDILHDSDAVLVEKEDVDLSVLAREVTPLVGNDP